MIATVGDAATSSHSSVLRLSLSETRRTAEISWRQGNAYKRPSLRDGLGSIEGSSRQARRAVRHAL
jgi:hypothetical protein